MTTPVTVIGLGLMGRALAAAFLRAGHPTTVWNRTPDRADALVEQGARRAASPAEAAAASPLVIVCVTDAAAVGDVLDALDEDAGRVLVNLTSGTSEQARELAARAGGRYLDGAIMAIPPAIGTEEAVVVLSGPRAAFGEHEPALRALGTVRHLGDDPALAALHEVAVLSVMWNVLNGFLHGAALLGAAGVDASAFAPLAQLATGTVAGWLPGYARQIDDGSYPALDSTVDTHRAAMDHLVDESEALGVDAGLPRYVRALADRAVAAGHGGDGYAALIGQFRS